MPKTPLHSAAQSGNMQQVMGLLRDGAAVTCWDKVSQPSRTPNATQHLFDRHICHSCRTDGLPCTTRAGTTASMSRASWSAGVPM
jgi:hypothetical protein